MQCRDKENAIAWKRTSKVRWLALEDPPSRYFFTQMKTTFDNETLQCIGRLDDSLVEEKEGLLQEVEAFYTDIYAKDVQIQLNEVERLRMLGLLSLQDSFIVELQEPQL